MGVVGTNAQAVATHSSALSSNADTVNGVVIPSSTSQRNPQAPIAAANFAREINMIATSYVPTLRRGADQIVQLHNRRVEEDAEASRQIGR